MNRTTYRTCTLAAALGLLAACSDKNTTAPPENGLAPGTKPNFAQNLPFNDEGACLSADAYLSGFTSGVSSATSLADPTKSCTSNDVRVASADVIEYSFNGTTFTPYTAGQTVTCNVGTPIFVRVAANLEETATSARSDIGIWVGLRGSNGRTGTCNHYNLVSPTPTGTVLGGVSNIDGDACGDMNAAATTNPPVPLGVIDAVCESAGPTSSLLHIGSCLAWTVPGSDQSCPQTRPGQTLGPNGFRWGTVPSAKSKCNCGGFDVPITVVRSPSLSLAKTADSASVSAGSQIGFTVTVANAGPGNATNVALVDTLPAGTGVLWSIGTSPVPTGWSLAGSAGSQILTYTNASLGITSTSVHVVSGTTAASCKQYDNTARLTVSNQAGVSPASASTTVNCPTLGITKTPASQTVAAGQGFSWTIALTNTGVGTAVGARIVDTLPVVTGVSYTLGTAAASCALVSGVLTCGPLDLAQNASISAVINATTLTSATCGGFTNTARGSASNNSNVQASATTTLSCPNLSITKTPDQVGDAGYTVTVPGTANFTITVRNSSAAGTGTATGVVLTDTLPAGVTWTANNTTECASPMATVTVSSVTRQILDCTIGTMAAGASFAVQVSASVTSSFLLQPPSASGTPLEIDGNLVDGAAAGTDWAAIPSSLLNCASIPKKNCDIDKATGTSDDSFGQGTKEDSPVPTVVSGSIPNNKSDLLRFYVGTERFVTTNFLYLAWERVQAPNGTTNMDFELNQSSQKSSNGVTPVRTAGDILIKYDLAKGGTVPALGFLKWKTTGSTADCEASSSLPCWSKATTLLNGASAAINTVSVTDPILTAGQSAGRSLDALTFGEASLDLQTTGIFQAGSCVSFGQAYLKSRSSDAFSSEIKDFLAPIPVSVTNCAPTLLNNTAWVSASNASAESDAGQINVTEP